MNGPLTGRSALVTGADRGIGRAVALRLARDGALVLVHCATQTDLAAEVVREVVDEGGRARVVRADLRHDRGVTELADAVRTALADVGAAPGPDVLVNNAAVTTPAPLAELTPELFDEIVAVNAKAPLFLLRELLPSMPDGASVINVSTGLTRFANPRELAVAMSKAALEMLALHLAGPLGERGISINTVAPGVTDNGGPEYADPQVRAFLGKLSVFGRIARAEEIAAVIAFLAGPDARWMTGTWVEATGGAVVGRLG